jgi:PAS domain-containing protein
MPDAVLIVEVPTLRVVFANRFAETITQRQFGRPANLDPTAAVEGQVLRPDGSVFERDDWPLMRAARGDKVTDEACTYTLPDGRALSLLLSAAPIEDGEGHIVAAVLIARDVSEQEEPDSASLGEGL